MNTLDELNALQLRDFCMVRFIDGGEGEAGNEVLTIHASNDFSYYRNAGIQFTGTVWIACPARFSHAQFREAPAAGAAHAASRSGGASHEGRLWRIETDTGVFTIAAHGVAVNIATVKYNATA